MCQSSSFGGESFTVWAAPFDFTENWEKIDEQNYTYPEREVKYCGPGKPGESTEV